MAVKKVIFCLVIFFLLASCESKQLPINFWQGVWTVSSVSFDETGRGEAVVIGYLLIEENQYDFTATGPNSKVQLLGQRLPFINEPSGTINVEVKPDSEQALSDLESGSTLALVKFGNWPEYFHILIDQDESKLWFHGEFAEFQIWGIERDIFDDSWIIPNARPG